MDPEIWIPSKQRIADRLVEDLKISLQVNQFRQVGFTSWIKENAGLLSYLGESYTSWIIRDVAADLELTLTEDGDYVK